jgi:glutamine synthetase
MLSKENGAPVGADSRQALAAVAKRYKDKGLTPVVATEMEFYLTSVIGGIPQMPVLPDAQRSLAMDNILSVTELDSLSEFFDDVYAACNAHDIRADSAISEGGAGQFEINLLHCADALKAADDALLFKTIVKSIARQHGFCATFMAKPFGDSAGNGLHVHFSILDKDGQNIFDNGTEAGSDALQYAVAGLLGAMEESTLVFAPHQNSYRRMRPGSHAPTGIAWGYENRTCAIRIPGGPHAARRIEHRVAGADANPYLMLSAILGAALIGMEAKVAPPAPLKGNAYEAQTPQLPMDWLTAIEAFRSGPTLSQVFDPLLMRLYAQAKHQELQHFLGTVSGAEHHAYLETV